MLRRSSERRSSPGRVTCGSLYRWLTQCANSIPMSISHASSLNSNRPTTACGVQPMNRSRISDRAYPVAHVCLGVSVIFGCQKSARSWPIYGRRIAASSDVVGTWSVPASPFCGKVRKLLGIICNFGADPMRLRLQPRTPDSRRNTPFETNRQA